MKICVLTSLNDANDIRIRKKFIKSILEIDGAYVDYYCVPSELSIEKNARLKYKFHNKPKGKMDRLLNNIKLFNKIVRSNYDIVQLCNPELLPISLLKFFKKKTIFIFDMHEDFESTIIDKSRSKKIGEILSAIYKHFISFLRKHCLDYVFVTTPLIKKKFNGRKTILIENFAPLIVDDLPNNLNDNNNKLVFVFTGLISEIRGITRFLSILKKYNHKDVVLVLMGNIDKSYLNRLNKEYSEFFEYKKTGTYQNMIETIKKSDVGLLSYLPVRNHLVTRPNKLFEYLMCSIPVLSCNYPLYSDVVNKGCGITMDIESELSINQAINSLKVMKQNNELLKMGEIGYSLYIEKYNWPQEFKKISNIYKGN
ncbi:glycosyltransferase [Macrococcoides bohemicum]|uniref:glycosyltransferase n=1 Tax=Macrococcoides bohemicum TaxID=1903056 RepID=UPI001C60790E|nr:glycosyltransferase [Macrococcus bohemicus]QYA44583.1 glycosyltransferase [Macrococcus bohemicus]